MELTGELQSHHSLKLGNCRYIPLPNPALITRDKRPRDEPRRSSRPQPDHGALSGIHSPLSLMLSPRSVDGFADWKTIGEQRDFCDEQDFFNPNCSLASERLKNRKEDDVVIFDYSLDPDYLSPAGGNPPVEEGGPSSRDFAVDDDIFFLVPKNKFIESNQFDQIINPGRESLQMLSRGARLGIM